MLDRPLRFVLDNDVDVSVATRLNSMGHEAWSVGAAALYEAADDDVTVYAAERDAIVITHDREFSIRRRENTIGRHIRLKCPEWEAADLIERHLPAVQAYLATAQDLYVEMSPNKVTTNQHWR